MSNAVSAATASQGGGHSRLSTARPVIVLVAICVVAGVLLGVVHQVTEPLAQANEARRAQEAYEKLMPSAASFEAIPCDEEGCVAALRALDASGSSVGTIVVAQSKGYGGQVPIAVGFATDGTVASILAMSNDETPGLGTRIAEEAYIGQYVGRDASQVDESSIDLISGATISSEAALAAFNNAVEVYQEVK